MELNWQVFTTADGLADDYIAGLFRINPAASGLMDLIVHLTFITGIPGNHFCKVTASRILLKRERESVAGYGPWGY